LSFVEIYPAGFEGPAATVALLVDRPPASHRPHRSSFSDAPFAASMAAAEARPPGPSGCILLPVYLPLNLPRVLRPPTFCPKNSLRSPGPVRFGRNETTEAHCKFIMECIVRSAHLNRTLSQVVNHFVPHLAPRPIPGKVKSPKIP